MRMVGNGAFLLGAYRRTDLETFAIILRVPTWGINRCHKMVASSEKPILSFPQEKKTHVIAKLRDVPFRRSVR